MKFGSRLYVVMAVVTAVVSVACGQVGIQKADQFQDEANNWPRVFQNDGNSVVLYQPQIDHWDNFETISARVAVLVQFENREDIELGSIRLTSTTSIDIETRSVLLGRRSISEIDFSNTDQIHYQRVVDAIGEALPIDEQVVLSLDEIIAYLDPDSLDLPEVNANLNPPPIHWSQSPAVLVIFFGEPKFEHVEEGSLLLFAVNTNWDVFLDSTSSRYYLLSGDSWLTTNDLNSGLWVVATSLPSSLKSLPKGSNWDEVRKRVPGKPAAFVPTVYVTNQPTELIVTDGLPQFGTIQGTNLLYVSNSDSDLFLYPDDGQFYMLVAGRWFRAKGLHGPWSAATNDLPVEFQKIQPDHELGRVLASVPGTSEAQAAAILATVPRKAIINKSEVSVEVVYEGDPEFIVIEDSDGVSFAINSPYDVFLVDGRYYCCYQGVWFVSFDPTGPWVVSNMVPAQIYTIPEQSPKHNVTYVYVIDSTPDTVVVSQTAGYQGQVVVGGLLMFGLGYAIAENHHDNHHWHHHYGPHYYSYGVGARYDYYHGGYYRSARVYGPYGGAGRSASYNPHTGTYSRGAYRYGPRGAVGARQAYNPYTNRYAAQVGASTPYGSWGRSAVSNGNDWARAGHRSTSRGTIAGAETSRGGKIVAAEGRYGGGGVVAKNKHGDMYVAKNGKVYSRNNNGTWQSRNTKPSNRKQTSPISSQRKAELNKQHRSRQQGTSRSQEYKKKQTAQRSRSSATRPNSSRTKSTRSNRSRSSGSRSRSSGGSRRGRGG